MSSGMLRSMPSAPKLSEEDQARVHAYGAQHPTSWVGIDHEGPALIVMFTDPAPHEAGVRGLLPAGALVEFRAVARTASDLDQLRVRLDSVLAEHPGTLHSWGTGVRTLDVHLRSTAGDLAERLHAEFGDALEIRLGAHRYPLDTGGLPLPAELGPVGTVSVPGLRATPVLGSPLVRAGEVLRGVVELRNDGRSEVRLETAQPVTGYLLHPDGTVAGRTSGGMRGTGRRIWLAPGSSSEVRFLAGTDSRDPANGATLPRGEYLLVVVLPVNELNGERPHDGRLVTSSVPVTVDATTH